MQGSMRLKRPPDYWEFRVFLGRDPVSGRQRSVSRSFRGGKRDASRALAAFVAEQSSGTAQTDMALEALMVTYIDHLENRGSEARTIEGYRSIARVVATDVIGRRPVDGLGPKDLDDFYLRMRRSGRSAATVKRYHTLLGGAMQQAVKWGWVQRNVVRLATPPVETRTARSIPKPEVVVALLREAAASRNPENQVALRLLAATGCRRGEVCGLRWPSVDLERRVIWIRHAVAQLSDSSLIEKDPKSHQTREVAIDRATVKMLADHLQDQRSFLAGQGITLSPEAYVLADLTNDPTGATPSRPDRLTQAFGRLSSRVAGAEGMRLHDLRHWYASTQLDAGEPLTSVAARIGDHVDTLAKVYAHRGHRSDHVAAENLAVHLDG